jgi:hypothetical protein
MASESYRLLTQENISAAAQRLKESLTDAFACPSTACVINRTICRGQRLAATEAAQSVTDKTSGNRPREFRIGRFQKKSKSFAFSISVFHFMI